jgi:two-component system, NtrC family, nitrogen regulation sensor histidine kinase NtrY
MFLALPGKKSSRTRRPPVPRFERRLLFSVLITGLPAVILCFVLLWSNPYQLDHKIEGTVLVVVFWLGLSFSARNGAVTSIRILSNVVASLREGDFTLRAPQGVQGDALGDLAIEINNFARTLEAGRLGVLEAETLLHKVIAEIEVVILALSPDNRVKLYNRAAALFVGKSNETLLNRTAEELGIIDLVSGPSSRTLSRLTGGLEKRWIVRRSSFRQQGISHRLIMLSEASEALRAEERLAWQRLVRVLSHEINNSLAPIKSAARTVARIASSSNLPEETKDTVELGLKVISSRAEALNRFLQGYAHLAKLPQPTRKRVCLRDMVKRLGSLESRLHVMVIDGPLAFVRVDGDQIEQALINLICNAVEAVLMKPDCKAIPSPVTVAWTISGKDAEICIHDKGIGLLDGSNLFVPFYTTKEKGTGIGLVLSRQIIEAHGGRLAIRNREDMSGCEVKIRLPGCVDADQMAKNARMNA